MEKTELLNIILEGNSYFDFYKKLYYNIYRKIKGGMFIMNYEIQTNNNNNSAGGGWFLSALAIVFIVLKLLGKITWSWVWVLSPIWIPLVLFTLALIIVYLLFKR